VARESAWVAWPGRSGSGRANGAARPCKAWGRRGLEVGPAYRSWWASGASLFGDDVRGVRMIRSVASDDDALLEGQGGMASWIDVLFHVLCPISN
jgi:hypothetical protein